MFYIVSTELREPYEPRSCRIVKRLRSEIRDDLALVEIDPPLPRHIYDTREDVQWVILAARYQGTTLFPVSEWPLAVYICRWKGDEKPESDTLLSTDLSIVDWGEIRQASTLQS